MASKYYPPTFHAKQFNCVRCGVFSAQFWGTPLRRNGQGFSDLTDWNYCTCSHCKTMSFWYQERMIVPSEAPVPPAHEDFPEECRADYNEARDIVARSPKAAAALLRLCLQKLLKELGEKGKNINDDIASLVQKGLPAAVQQALDFCRIVGNNAVHPGELSLDDTPEIANALFEMLNFIVEQRITQLKRIDAFYAVLSPKARETIDKRDGKPAA
jgi:hypothetical protein